jgi:cysteinyl-tRNA synthetase
MKLYNTLSKAKEEFVPLEEGKVKMYVCGPTVYNYFHIGNARPFIVFDVLRSFLSHKGFSVTYVQNFTDVDDKIIHEAARRAITPKQLSDFFIEAYFEDAGHLGIKKADAHPRVSDCIPEIVSFVSSLIEKGHAYVRGGDVYYRVSSFPSYGELTGQSAQELFSGARVEVNESKESALDFALWKARKEGEPYWPSPWGEGRPGWHIECSAMSAKYLGEEIDIHGGGADLAFPHHTNEIAQSEGASGKKFVRYWLHNGFLVIGEGNDKMSKSLGNFLTAREAIGLYGGESIRLFILSVAYRSPLTFSEAALSSAKAGLERLYIAKGRLREREANGREGEPTLQEAEACASLDASFESFEAALDDDLNTANAVSALYEMARKANSAFGEDATKAGAAAALKTYLKAAGILRLLSREDGILDKAVEALIEERNAARARKDYKRGDEIRDELRSLGILLEDTKQGVKWRRA